MVLSENESDRTNLTIRTLRSGRDLLKSSNEPRMRAVLLTVYQTRRWRATLITAVFQSIIRFRRGAGSRSTSSKIYSLGNISDKRARVKKTNTRSGSKNNLKKTDTRTGSKKSMDK